MLSLLFVLMLSAWADDPQPNPCLDIKELRPFDPSLEKVGKSDTKVFDWEHLDTAYHRLAKRFFPYPVIHKAHVTDGTKMSVAVDRAGIVELKTTEVRLFIPRDDGTYEVHKAMELAGNKGIVPSPMEIQEKGPVSTGGVKTKNKNRYSPQIAGLSLEEVARHYYKMDGMDFSHMREASFNNKPEIVIHAYAIANSEQASEIMKSGMQKFNLTNEALNKIIESGNVDFIIDTLDVLQVKFEALLRSLHVVKKNAPELYKTAKQKLSL